jgi:hypothetical protein
MPMDDFRVVEHDGQFYVNNPMWNDTPSRYYAGPFSEAKAQEFAAANNRSARIYMASLGGEASAVSNGTRQTP